MGEDLYRLLSPRFELPPTQYVGRVTQVRIGNASPEGTRAYVILLGGAKNLPFFDDPSKTGVRPSLAMQVQARPDNIPTTVSTALGDLMNDPVEWARFCIKECGAEAVQLKFNVKAKMDGDGTLEGIKGLSRRLVEELDVPLIFSGPDSKELEPPVLEAVASATRGERVLLASARLDNDYERIAKAAITNGHVVLASSYCDPPSQKMLNDRLLDIGLSKDQLVIDPTTAALGYGLEYSLSITEQIRLNALKGDRSLQMPVAAFPASSWTAREANLEGLCGDLYSRGLIWELTTAIAMFLAGAELLVMLHPEAVRRFRLLMGEAGFSEPPTVKKE